jgi:hypothetical protein
MEKTALLLLGLGVSACFQEAPRTLLGDGRVSCTGDGDCPAGARCAAVDDSVDGGARCFDASAAPPTLSAVVSPAVTGPTGTVDVSVDVDAAAVVRVTLDGASASLDDAGTLSFANLAHGPHDVRIRAVDPATGLFADVDTGFDVDARAPVVVDVGFAAAKAKDGVVSFTVVCDEALGAAPVLRTRPTTAALSAEGPLAAGWLFTLDAAATDEGEVEVVGVDVVDVYGNVASAEVNARLAIDRTAPVVSGLVFAPAHGGRAALSAQPTFSTGVLSFVATGDDVERVSVRLDDAALPCDDGAGGGRHRCVIDASGLSGSSSRDVIASVVAVDDVGNVSDAGIANITFDFAGPRAIAPPTLIAGNGALARGAVPVVALGATVELRAVFDEPALLSAPTLCEVEFASEIVGTSLTLEGRVGQAHSGTPCDAPVVDVRDDLGNITSVAFPPFVVDAVVPVVSRARLVRDPFGVGAPARVEVDVDEDGTLEVVDGDSDVIARGGVDAGGGAVDVGGGDVDDLFVRVVDDAGNPSAVVAVAEHTYIASFGRKVAGRPSPNPSVAFSRPRFVPVIDDDETIDDELDAALSFDDDRLVSLVPRLAWSRVRGEALVLNIGQGEGGYDPLRGELILRWVDRESRERDGDLFEVLSLGQVGETEPFDGVAGIFVDPRVDALVYVDVNNGAAYQQRGNGFTSLSKAAGSLDAAAFDVARGRIVALRAGELLTLVGRDWVRTGAVAPAVALVATPTELFAIGDRRYRLVDDTFVADSDPIPAAVGRCGAALDDTGAVAVNAEDGIVYVVDDNGAWRPHATSQLFGLARCLAFDARRGALAEFDPTNGVRAVFDGRPARGSTAFEPSRVPFREVVYDAVAQTLHALDVDGAAISGTSTTFTVSGVPFGTTLVRYRGGRVFVREDVGGVTLRPLDETDRGDTFSGLALPAQSLFVDDGAGRMLTFDLLGRTVALGSDGSVTVVAPAASGLRGPFIDADGPLRVAGAAWQRFTGAGWVDVGVADPFAIVDSAIFGTLEIASSGAVLRRVRDGAALAIDDRDGVAQAVGGAFMSVALDDSQEEIVAAVRPAVADPFSARLSLAPTRAGLVAHFDVNDVRGAVVGLDVDVDVRAPVVVELLGFTGAGFERVSLLAPGRSRVSIDDPGVLSRLQRANGTVVFALASPKRSAPFEAETLVVDGIALGVRSRL